MMRTLAVVVLVAQLGVAQPNIVLFYADDLGWRDLACMGSKFYDTPHIDRLAAEGMLFTDAYANAPNCAPSRACLMSGQYTPRHGVFTVGAPNRGRAALRRLIAVENKTVLDERFVTMAESLKGAGYRTATMGKWHLGDDPTTQGFDLNVGGFKAGHPKSYFSPYKNPKLQDGAQGEYLTDRLTDAAVSFIREKDERPFFLYLTHYAVHTPLQAKQDDMARFADRQPDRGQKNKKYAGMVYALDRSMGRVLEALKAAGKAEDTLVVFFSDNGGHMGATSCKPLRGAKGTLYEGGIRVPMIVRWPDKVKAGSRSATPVIGVDLYPTFLSAAGAKRPEGYTLDGEDITPVFKGQVSLADRPLFWHFPAYLQGRFEKDMFRTRPGAVVRRGKWKLIEFFEDKRLELYDLSQDRGETANVAAAHPDVTRELHALMTTWRLETGAPVPTKANPKFDPDAKPMRRGGE